MLFSRHLPLIFPQDCLALLLQQLKNLQILYRLLFCGHKKYSKDIDSEFNYEGFENWKQERENEKNKIYNLIIINSNYLNSIAS